MADITSKVKKILEKSQGDYSLDSEEFDTLLKASGDNKILSKLGLGDSESMKQEIAAILQGASNSENYFERLEKKVKRGQITEDILTGLNVVRDFSQIGMGLRQARQSDRALSRLRRPVAPATPGIDPRLDYALGQAERGTLNASTMIEPARMGIERGFASDLAAARGAVGGQSGAYGALAQTAALRRNRGYSELAPVIDNIRAREQSRVDDLLSRRAGQRQADFENRMRLFDQANQNYNTDVNAASDLGLAGRENIVGAMGQLPGNLAAAGGALYGRGRLSIPNRNNLGYQVPAEEKTMVPEIDDFQDYLINNSLLYNPNKYQAQQSPYYNPRYRTV